MHKTAASRRKLPWSTLIWSSAIFAVIVYNGWRLCCGQCTLSDFVIIPWTGWLLVAINLSAAAVLWGLRRYPQTPSSGHCAACQAQVDAHWSYCPRCGTNPGHTKR